MADAALRRAPMVATVHGFSGPRILPAGRGARSALVSISDADRLLGEAAASLRPIAFDEPCGTPVAAHTRGAMPEAVGDGVTGVLACDLDTAVDAAGRAGAPDRAPCRDRARERFGADRTVDDCLAVLGRLAPLRTWKVDHA